MRIRAALRPVRRTVSRAALPFLIRPVPGFAGEVVDLIRVAKANRISQPNLDHWRYPDARAEVFNPTEAAKILSFVRANADALNKTAALFADQASRDLLKSLLAYRALGPSHVRLPRSNPQYMGYFGKARTMRTGPSKFDFPPFPMDHYSVDGIEVDCWLGNVVAGIEKQYWFKRDIEIAPEPGDVVIDCGACFGDTALYFADAVGSGGRVHAFEPVPLQCGIMAHNLGANPKLADRITHHRFATGSVSGQQLFFGEGAGASSAIGGDNPVLTLAVDDLGLERVDYIKMDVEGAETETLKGAAETIRRFKPKLGISVYHSLNDLILLPQLVHEIEPSYALYLDHHTIYAEETVLYARSR